MYLSIRHRTRFTYPEQARQSHNEVRATPTTDDHQRLLAYQLTTVPPARSHTYVDYWGSLVDAFGIRVTHSSLEVTIDAVVETHAPAPTAEDASLESLREPGFRDSAWEYLQATRHTEPTVELAATAAAEAAQAAGCLDLIGRLSTAVHGLLVYEAGATAVGETVETVLAKGRGVCQDYAHVMVAAARSVGLPCRYVSGYLYAAHHDTGEPADTHESVSVQTHAWVEALVPGLGWVPCDPTNQQPVGEAHVKIGSGRDYDDVPPLKGVYTGGGEATLDAEVNMRRLAEPQGLARHSPATPQMQQ